MKQRGGEAEFKREEMQRGQRKRWRRSRMVGEKKESEQRGRRSRMVGEK
jgi:hypothetical protein